MSEPKTAYDIIKRSADRYGSKTALTFLKVLAPDIVDETASYSELLDNIHRMVRLVHDHSQSTGQSTGNRRAVVSFLLPSIPQTHYILFGAGTAGIANPLNPLLNEDALSGLMEKAETDILIALGPNPHSDIWQKATSVVERLTKKPILIPAVFSDGVVSDTFEALLERYSSESLPSEWLPKSEDIAAYFHTGGTTGSPRLAMHTHANHVVTANAYLNAIATESDDVYINGMPLFHVAGALAMGLGNLAAGSNVIIPTMGGFRNPQVIKQYWKLVEHYRVTIGGAIASTYAVMADVPLDSADISSLRLLVSGGAPVPLSVFNDIKKLTGFEIYQGYGMTETAGVIALPNLSCPALPDSAGHVIGDIDVRIDTHSDEPGAVGEICVRGPGVFPGYLGDKVSPLDDGWLRTGDLGYLDENNNLFITGRAKDLIIRSGHNIDPVTIEACLESHPAVAMAAAVGKPDDYAGELPTAYVQLHVGSLVTEDELRVYVLANIDERPACPKAVTILDQLPVTAVGKVHKPTLRALAAEQSVKEYLSGFSVDIKGSVMASGGIEITVSSKTSDESLIVACDELVGRLGIKMTVDKTV